MRIKSVWLQKMKRMFVFLHIVNSLWKLFFVSLLSCASFHLFIPSFFYILFIPCIHILYISLFLPFIFSFIYFFLPFFLPCLFVCLLFIYLFCGLVFLFWFWKVYVYEHILFPYIISFKVMSQTSLNVLERQKWLASNFFKLSLNLQENDRSTF